MGNYYSVVDLGRSFCCGFSHNWLVRLTVNEYLPPSLSFVATGLAVIHYRETPFFKKMHGGIDVSCDIEF